MQDLAYMAGGGGDSNSISWVKILKFGKNLKIGKQRSSSCLAAEFLSLGLCCIYGLSCQSCSRKEEHLEGRYALGCIINMFIIVSCINKWFLGMLNSVYHTYNPNSPNEMQEIVQGIKRFSIIGQSDRAGKHRDVDPQRPSQQLQE